VLPSQEALAQRLFAQGQELAELQRTLTRYHALFEALRARLDAAPPPAAADLARLLDEGLARAISAPAPGGDVVALDAMLRVMSAHVTVKPSGREFFVEGSETLLKAALRAGLAPNYGCGNGNCGLCKARVVAGEARDVAPSDYLFFRGREGAEPRPDVHLHGAEFRPGAGGAGSRRCRRTSPSSASSPRCAASMR
jgi:CDP-4-dehydro-6-deoxyglucose reductase